ncbi:TonB-dependent siderophore receptor [Sphingomonas solaris]|uniref:TonB-dependent siderophore receptor n=2 Tax=Alterirhizorhabdus solaris TaxID=2529389 RepID=A0A558R0L1_9SPHN|nr:TonB-dependent siderophore receptor [Sphingomonas solaris]
MVALLAMMGQVAQAEVAEAAGAEAAAQTRNTDNDITVIGKSYGQEVGKTLTPLKDVPNTVTIIDRAQIEAQNLFTLEDALTATNGITVTGVGSEDPSFLSRGFAINNYLVDGTPTFSFGFPAVVPDLFSYDRLEVLRGPAGLFSGSGNPAGSVNFVRKRPLDAFKISASLGYGSYDNKRGELDISTPIGDRAGLRGGVMVQDQDQFYDVAHRNRHTAFLVGKLDVGDRTTITVGGNYDRFKPAVQTGLPGIIGGLDGSDGQLLDVRRSTYVGADWNRFRSEIWTAFADITHRLSDRWTLRASGLFTDVDRLDVYSYIGSQPITPTNGITSHIAYIGDSKQKTASFDFNGVGSFPLFGRDQTLILGADYQANLQKSAFTRLSNYARIDVYDPVSPAEPVLNPYVQLPPLRVPITPQNPTGIATHATGRTETDVEQYGLYGQMRLSPLDGVTLIGGGRLTWWDTENRTLYPVPANGVIQTGYTIENRFTPYAGIVWDVTGQLNLYGSYADSFTPQTSALPRAGGGAIQPLVGEQYEAGSKLTLFDRRLLLSAAVYQIKQSNRLFTDAATPDVVYQIGAVRSRGFEAGAQGEILPGWLLNGGYSYTKTKYLEDSNTALEGFTFVPVIPKHAIKGFTNYAPVTGPLAGFSVGGSVTWLSKTFAGSPAFYNPNGSLRTRSSIVRQGGYALVDLRAGYRISEQIGLSVNVNNLFDKNYYARLGGTGRGNFYGSPRTVFATLRLSTP